LTTRLTARVDAALQPFTGAGDGVGSPTRIRRGVAVSIDREISIDRVIGVQLRSARVIRVDRLDIGLRVLRRRRGVPCVHVAERRQVILGDPGPDRGVRGAGHQQDEHEDEAHDAPPNARTTRHDSH